MDVVSICKQLQKNIQRENMAGVVHSVFDSAFNVITSDNEFVTFIIFNKPMAPSSIKLSDNKSYLKMGIESGMRIYFYNEYAWLESLNISFKYGTSLPWDKSPVFSYFKDNIENVYSKLNIINKFLKTYGKMEGILSLLTTLNESYIGLELNSNESHTLDKKEQFIKDRFLSFIEAYSQECNTCIADRVKNIIGFGAGLTPSMDDFISGLMISRIYLHDYLNKDVNLCYKFNEQMINKIGQKTTKVSEEMLKLSSKGEVNEQLRNLVLSLISNATIEELVHNLEAVSSFGETSGTDIISGIYIGSKIALNQYSRR